MAGRKEGFGRLHSHQEASMVFDVSKTSPPSQEHQRTAKPSHLHAHPQQFQPWVSPQVPGSRKAHLHSHQTWGFAGSRSSAAALLEIRREESAAPRVLLVLLQAGSYTGCSEAQRVSAPGKCAGVTWAECSGSMGKASHHPYVPYAQFEEMGKQSDDCNCVNRLLF